MGRGRQRTLGKEQFGRKARENRDCELGFGPWSLAVDPGWLGGSWQACGKVGLELNTEKGSSRAVLEWAAAGNRYYQREPKGRWRRGPTSLAICLLQEHGCYPCGGFANISVQLFSLACGRSLSCCISAGAKRSYWFSESNKVFF